MTRVTDTVPLSVTVNGEEYSREVPARTLLVDFLREELGLTGTKIGCETSACGCCTVLLDGDAVKSCTLFSFQADRRRIRTIEGLAHDEGMRTIQDAFSEHHALQCGYCTSGLVMTATSFLDDNPEPSREDIRKGIAGNICRCTGYRFVLDAVEYAADVSDSGERPPE